MGIVYQDGSLESLLGIKPRFIEIQPTEAVLPFRVWRFGRTDTVVMSDGKTCYPAIEMIYPGRHALDQSFDLVEHREISDADLVSSGKMALSRIDHEIRHLDVSWSPPNPFLTADGTATDAWWCWYYLNPEVISAYQASKH